MQIHGLNKTTLLDYPEHLACTVFTGGCNLRCPFCHNSTLVLEPNSQPIIAETDFFDFLTRRKGILEGVCITGGEPTLQTDLIAFIEKIKECGFLVKLDTNGTDPATLKALLNRNLIDYTAMDIKADPDHYALAVGKEDFDPSSIEESAKLLMTHNIPYEFRTTVVRGIHTEDILLQIGKWLNGASALYLQTYREIDAPVGFYTGSPLSMSAFSPSEMQHFAELLAPYFHRTAVRG